MLLAYLKVHLQGCNLGRCQTLQKIQNSTFCGTGTSIQPCFLQVDTYAALLSLSSCNQASRSSKICHCDESHIAVLRIFHTPSAACNADCNAHRSTEPWNLRSNCPVSAKGCQDPSFHSLEALEGAQRILLAVDTDEPGQALAEELARRLGPGICWLVSWTISPESPFLPRQNPATPASVNAAVQPRVYKDANEVLMAEGPEALRACVAAARPFPVPGLQE